MLRHSLIAATLFVAGSITTNSQQVPSAPVRGAGTNAVVADVIVRDAKGNPVTGLTKGDFQLFEDGVPQQIGDVTAVGVAAASAAMPVDSASPSRDRSASSAAVPVASGAGPTYMALVFDRLSPEARAASYKGALAAVDTMRPNDFVGVFLADLSLTTIQSYTNDRAKLRIALKDVATRATSVFDRKAIRTIGESGAAGDADPSVDWTAGAESGGRFANPDQPDLITVQSHNLWEVMARNQQGFATTDALLAIASVLGTLPGRKTVVFFAEGLALPPAVYPLFKNVVTTANRGNVSVYTIDAAGLRAHSADGETARAVRAIGAAGIATNADGSNQSSLGLLEYNEDVLRKNPHTSLTLLAQETGGFLMENTNDLGRAFRQIDRDRHYYYLLTYQPTNTIFDGKWRSITVKVPDRHCTVSSRLGYLAVKSPAGLPLLAYEGPALAALTRTPPPSDLPLRSAALVFPQGRLAVLAATDGNALRFDRDEGKKSYTADFTILARIVSMDGRVVRSASQPYHLTGAIDDLERAKAGEILFFRHPTLSPGRYTLEVALHDALAERSAVQRTSFIVGDTSGMQVGTLVLVQRAERVKPEEQPSENPLLVDKVLLYPNLGEALQKSKQKSLAVFAVIAAGAGPTPTATLRVLRDTIEVASIPVPLTREDIGRLHALAELSLENLPPGRYAVQLQVVQPGRLETRERAFELKQ